MAESGAAVGVSLWDVFSKVPDPRDASGRRFPLQGILALTVAALISGRQGLSAIARWGRGCSKKQLARSLSENFLSFGCDVPRQAPSQLFF